MNFYKENEIPERPVLLVCRESRVVHFFYLIAMMVFAGIVLAIVLQSNHSGGVPSNLFDFIGIIVGCCSFPLLFLIVLITTESLVASYKKSNWVLKVYEDGLLIKFRSYLNHHFDTGDPCVVYIPKSEVISVNKTIKQIIPDLIKPSSEIIESGFDSKNAEKNIFLDIIVNTEKTEDLKQAILKEKELPPQKKIFSKSKAIHYPVNVIDNKVIRIDWKTGKSSIKPSLNKAISILSDYYKAENTVTEKFNMQPKNDEEFNYLVLEKALAGEKITAIKMIRDHYGYNLTRAKAFLDELMSE